MQVSAVFSLEFTRALQAAHTATREGDTGGRQLAFNAPLYIYVLLLVHVRHC